MEWFQEVSSLRVFHKASFRWTEWSIDLLLKVTHLAWLLPQTGNTHWMASWGGMWQWSKCSILHLETSRSRSVWNVVAPSPLAALDSTSLCQSQTYMISIKVEILTNDEKKQMITWFLWHVKSNSNPFQVAFVDFCQNCWMSKKKEYQAVVMEKRHKHQPCHSVAATCVKIWDDVLDENNLIVNLPHLISCCGCRRCWRRIHLYVKFQLFFLSVFTQLSFQMYFVAPLGTAQHAQFSITKHCSPTQLQVVYLISLVTNPRVIHNFESPTGRSKTKMKTTVRCNMRKTKCHVILKIGILF